MSCRKVFGAKMDLGQVAGEPEIIDYPEDRKRLIEAFSTVTETPEFRRSVKIGKERLGIKTSGN